jgi:hypothetical protein
MSDETAIEYWNSNSAFGKALAACRVICPDVVCHCIYVAFGSFATVWPHGHDFRSAQMSGRFQRRAEGLKRADDIAASRFFG